MSEWKNECIEDYLKFIVVYLLSLAITLLMIKGVLLMDIFDVDEQPTDIVLALLAAITLFFTFREYRYHRRREIADVLGQYNERYSRDEHINRVVDYIIRRMNNDTIIEKPSTHDAEMFMRFFEEMEIQISENRLNPKQVCDLFSYYAIIFGDDESLRNSLGVTDFDNSDNWKNFKVFVKKMKMTRKNEINLAQSYNFIPIHSLYKDVIGYKTCWNYYDINTDIKNLTQLYNINNTDDKYDYNYEFIKELLEAGGKDLSGKLQSCLDVLMKNEKNSTDKELSGRLRHIVSLFFWGHVLYRNVPIIQNQIERQFQTFVENGMFEVADNIQQNFSFMWFLLCIFHDFGYAYEKKLIPETNCDLGLEMPDAFIPVIYSKENNEKYARYRHCVFGCYDHGIFGGRVFYSEMLNIGRRIAADNKFKIHFKTDGVEKLYQYAAWIISCHNMFYNTGNDKYTRCYKCMGLDDFVKPKARCLTLKNNPLLFLFCLADSIEPTKALTSEDGESDYEICKKLRIGFNKDENLMRFDLSNISCKEVAEKYKKNINSLNDWLIDVSDDLTIRF